MILLKCVVDECVVDECVVDECVVDECDITWGGEESWGAFSL